MKRFLIFLVLLGAAVYFGGKFYYQHQITQSLDGLISPLRTLGSFSYNNVEVTASGEAHINKIRLQLNGYSDELLIDRLSLRTGNLLGLYQLDKEIQAQQVPEKLGISIRGLQILTGGQLYRSAEAANTSGSFYAAGCGERQSFSGHDLMDMGYQELVIDTDLDYQLINQGQQLQFTARTFTRNIARMDFVTELQLGASSRASNAIAAALARAELISVDINYQDLGYASEVVKFCMAQTQLNREDYLRHHLAAWKDHWHRLDLQAGANLVAAYEAFLAYPDEFSVKLQTATRMPLTQLLTTPASLLIYQLQGKMQVNRKSLGNLDFTALTDDEQQTFASRSAEQAKQLKPAAQVVETKPAAIATPDRLTPDNLDRHIGKMVRIKLHSGKDYQGRIRSVAGGRLQLQRFASGGHMMMPVMVQEIAEVRLIE